MLWALICKEFEQNAKSLLYVLAGALVLLFLSMFLKKDGSAAFEGIIVGYLVVSVPILFGQVFIGLEKTKGSFKFLKMLPVSGIKVMAAKYLTGAITCVFLIDSLLVLEPLTCRTSGQGGTFPFLLKMLWMDAVSLFLLAGIILITSALDQRLAMQVPYWIMLGLVTIAIGIQKIVGDTEMEVYGAHAQALIRGTHAVYWGIVAVVLISFLMVVLAGRVFDRLEWEDLQEN